jgi:phosphoribosylformimino-5-aminoimidazole carboxamide ribotide isomerase
MIAYAAIDVHGAHVVQLVGGDTQEARVVLDDPVNVAQSWEKEGFAGLHMVDLDAALGTGDNRELIRRAMQSVQVPVQVGGGIRSAEDVAYWLDAGAAQVIIGTRALQDRQWLRNIADQNPRRILVAADVRDGLVVTHGWRRDSEIPVVDYIADLNEISLGGILVTDVDREGRLLGANAGLFGEIIRIAKHPVIASGGIANNGDLEALDAIGISGVILGMALYTGAIDTSLIRKAYTR